MRKTVTFFLSTILLLFVFPITPISAFEIDQTTTCTRVKDGDSFVTTFGEIRLADIDAPEYNDASRNALSAIILNKQIFLDIDDVYRTDQYGRYVCVCYVKSGDSQYLNVNKYLVLQGYAEIQNYNNEFNPNSWTLYYSTTSNGGTGDHANVVFNIVLPTILLGAIAIFVIISYSRIKQRSQQPQAEPDVKKSTDTKSTTTYTIKDVQKRARVYSRIFISSRQCPYRFR